MNVDHVRGDWFTRRRYVLYILIVSLVGGFAAGYLLADEHTVPALVIAGLVAIAAAVPRALSRRSFFDERDRHIDGRAAVYVMYLVTASSVAFLAGPIVLEQLGVLAVEGWMLVVGLVLIVQVYCYVAISLLLRYRA